MLLPNLFPPALAFQVQGATPAPKSPQQNALTTANQTTAPAADQPTPNLFVTDFRCSTTSPAGPVSAVSGFTSAINVSCKSGYLTPETVGSPMRLLRPLNSAPAAATVPVAGQPLAGTLPSDSYVLEFRANFAPGGNKSSAGFTTAAPPVPDPALPVPAAAAQASGNPNARAPIATPGTAAPASSAQSESVPGPRQVDSVSGILLTLTTDGFGLKQGSQNTVYLPVAGLAAGIRGSNDSGPAPNNARYGWTAPTPGMYDVSLFRQADGSAVLSIMHPDTVNNSASFRIPSLPLPSCAAECAPQTLEINAAFPNTDRIADALYQFAPGAPQTPGTNASPVQPGFVLPPHSSSEYRAGAYLRWYIGADGQPCDPGASACTNVWAYVPPTYDPAAKNKWVIAAHGYGEDGQILQQEYNSGQGVSDTLFGQGYVLVSLDNVDQNCYGNQQCVADVAHATATVQAALSLEDQPYAMADSMGGEQILNAITHGVLQPRAFAGFSINTSLAWQNDPNTGRAGALVQQHYGFTDPAAYATATAGYDPLLATGPELQRLAAVPMLLFADPADPIVNKAANTDALAKKLTRAGGIVQVISTTGGHVAPDNFRGPAVAAFFAAH